MLKAEDLLASERTGGKEKFAVCLHHIPFPKEEEEDEEDEEGGLSPLVSDTRQVKVDFIKTICATHLNLPCWG